MRLLVANTRTGPVEAGWDLMRKRFLEQSLLGLLTLASMPAASADCSALSGQVINWIVPTQPGGGYDSYSRLIGPFLEQRLDAQVVIENRAEAGGIVAAMAVRDALPDGKTMGIINASGLLAAGLMPDSPAPHPLVDFTILARVVSNRMFLFTGAGSGIADIHELLKRSAERPVVVGVRDAGSASFFAIPIVAALLGLNYDVVTGYVGSSSRVLAAMRGEVDVIMQNFDSVRRYVDSGELRPLLQISSPASGSQEPLPPNSVPRLGGPDGLATQVIKKSGKTARQAELETLALSGIISAGRLIVAPVGLAASIEACLQSSVLEVLQSEELKDAAALMGLVIEPADAIKARADLQASQHLVADFAPLVRSAIEQARQ